MDNEDVSRVEEDMRRLRKQAIETCSTDELITYLYEALRRRSPREQAESFTEPVMEEVEKIARERMAGDKTDIARINNILCSTMYDLDNIEEKRGQCLGIATGLKHIDDVTSGFQGSQMIVIAGRSCMGKTTMAMNIAEHAALEQKIPVLYFGLETSKEQIAESMLYSFAGLDAYAARGGYLSESQWPALSFALGKLSEAPIFIDDTPMISLTALRARAEMMKQEREIGLIIIDYLQLMEAPRAEDRAQGMSTISRTIKALAKTLDVPIVVLSQLEQGPAKKMRRPRMEDFGEASAMANDADIVMILHREEYYSPHRMPGMAEVFITKNRNGPTMNVDIDYHGDLMRFGEIPGSGK